MELLDFNKWEKILESVDLGKTTKIFKFSPRFAMEVNTEYYNIADSLLKEDATTFEYTLTSNDDGTINISIGEEEDEIRSSIFGAPESFNITLGSLTVNKIFGNIPEILTPNSLHGLFKRFFSNYGESVGALEKDGTSDIIKVHIRNSEFEEKLQKIATRISLNSKFRFPTIYSEPPRPTHKEYDDALRYANNGGERSESNPVTELSDKLNEIIKYRTALSILHKISSNYIVDSDKLTSDIYGKTNEFKSIDLSSLSEEDRKSKIDEILKFQTYVLRVAASVSITESKLATDALIDIFRILLTEYKSPLEIKRELNRIARER